MRFTVPRPQAKTTVYCMRLQYNKVAYRPTLRCVTNLYCGPRGVEMHPLDHAHWLASINNQTRCIRLIHLVLIMPIGQSVKTTVQVHVHVSASLATFLNLHCTFKEHTNMYM